MDVDPACEYPYEANNDATFLLKSVEDLKAADLGPSFRKSGIKLLAGCAPCQTFSAYNPKATESDGRWGLLNHFSRLVEELDPDLVTMENVPRLLEQDVFSAFVDTLERNGYFLNHYRSVVNCVDYGVPQHRTRLVLLASRFGPIELLQPSLFGRKRKTVKQAIGWLPRLSAGGSDPKDPLHRCSKLSEVNLRRIQSSRPGGTWRDWPEDLIADCHQKNSGKTYSSVYGRMTWNAPAPTMTTQFYGFGNGRFGHPQQHRAISLREGAILQSFPKQYKFVRPGDPIFQKAVGRLIGNAVPVMLGEAIGRTLLEHVSETARDNK